MDKIIENLINNLRNIFEDRLESVFLYGSAVDENFDQKISDINLMIILDKLSAQDLKLAFPAIKNWRKTRNPLPVFMDKEEWFNSSDIYAIEYADIIDKHKILYGKNLINNLTVNKANLRLECESNLKHLLINLREFYLANHKDKKALETLIIKGVKNSIAIFRSISRLIGYKDIFNTQAIIKNLANEAAFDDKIFIEALLLKEKKKKLHNDQIEIVTQEMINSLNSLLKYVDKIKI